jgi:hypothetical protein
MPQAWPDRSFIWIRRRDAPAVAKALWVKGPPIARLDKLDA